MDKSQLEDILQRQLPLANSMEVRILRADDHGIELTCPLSKNYNHLGTAFGGSLCALMILASYCRLFYLISGNGHVVLKKAETEFLKPTSEDLVAHSLPPTQLATSQFFKTFRSKGCARIELISEIRLSDGSVAARLKAEFVGLSNSRSEKT